MIADIQALVASLLLPRVRAALDGERAAAVAPLLSAEIAGMLRALPDVELLALCAPELRARLGIDARPFPSPARRERLLRRRQVQRGLRRVRRWIWRAQARAVEGNRIPWRPGFSAASATIMIRPLPAPPVVLEDLGPLEDDVPGLEIAANEEPCFSPLERVERELLGEEAHRLDPVGFETTRADVAPPPSLRRLPVLSPDVAPPIVLRTKGPATPPAHLEAVPVEQLASPEQRFKCVPFSAVIPASTCLDRQAAARAEVHGPGSRANNEKRALARRFGRCESCSLGIRVSAQARRAS